MKQIYNEALEFLNEATNQFSPLWCLNKKAAQKLLTKCEQIDSISNQYKIASVTFEIDELTLLLCLTIEFEKTNAMAKLFFEDLWTKASYNKEEK